MESCQWSLNYTTIVLGVSVGNFVSSRKLSMELDMLLNDLPPAGGPRPKLPTPSTTAYRIPLSGPGLDNIQYLQKQEEALEGEVVNLTNKRQQLAGELEGLISQVCGHVMVT